MCWITHPNSHSSHRGVSRRDRGLPICDSKTSEHFKLPPWGYKFVPIRKAASCLRMCAQEQERPCSYPGYTTHSLALHCADRIVLLEGWIIIFWKVSCMVPACSKYPLNVTIIIFIHYSTHQSNLSYSTKKFSCHSDQEQNKEVWHASITFPAVFNSHFLGRETERIGNMSYGRQSPLLKFCFIILFHHMKKWEILLLFFFYKTS